MPKTTSEQNKALVLEAFDTLFNKRDYTAADAIGHLSTFSTALILSLVVKAYSISSRAFPQR
jgi:hypothetical protein